MVGIGSAEDSQEEEENDEGDEEEDEEDEDGDEEEENDEGDDEEEDEEDEEESVLGRPDFSIERVEIIGFRHGTGCETKRLRRDWWDGEKVGDKGQWKGRVKGLGR